MSCDDLTCPTYLNDTMQAVLDDVCAGLACTVFGAPNDCFISHTAPPDDCCDFLAIWMDVMQPTMQFPVVNTSIVDRCGETGRMMRLAMRLRRSCYPVIRDNAKSPFPPPAEMQAAAEGLLVDANVVWCRLISGFSEGVYALDDPACPSGCLDWKMGELRMDPPKGGCAGFTVTFAAELEGCC